MARIVAVAGGVGCQSMQGTVPLAAQPTSVPVAQAVPLARVLESIALPGICETSGATVDSEGAIWMVDDDQDAAVFRWQGPGTAPERLALPSDDGAPPVHDMEGLAWQGASLWVLGSHSRTSKGKLKRRARVVQWSSDARDAAPAVWSLWPDSKTAEPEPVVQAVARLCPSCAPDEAWSRLNFEGLAAPHTGATLLVGLREPTDRAGATYVLELATPQLGANATDAPSAPEVRAVHRVELQERGIRAMSPAPTDGELWLVSGRKGAARSGGSGFVVSAWSPGQPARLLARLPELSGAPEAIVPVGPEEALVFLDEGRRLEALPDRNGKAPHRLGGAGGKFRCGEGADPDDGALWAHAIRVGWAKTVSPGPELR